MRVYDLAEGSPRDQAISMMYQDYAETQGFAGYVLDHPAELGALIKKAEGAERARKEKFPDMPR